MRARKKYNDSQTRAKLPSDALVHKLSGAIIRHRLDMFDNGLELSAASLPEQRLLKRQCTEILAELQNADSH